MSSIILRTISAIDDVKLVLSNDRAARNLLIGNAWNHIRLGVRLCANAAAAISSGNLAIGVGYGQVVNGDIVNVYGDQTPAHFVGIRTSPIPNPNFNYSAGPPAQLLQINPVGCVVVAGVETIGADIGLTDLKISAQPADTRSVIFVEITKGSPNYTITAGYLQGTVADITLASFKTGMETTMANIVGWNPNYKKGSDVTMAVNEANGVLDTFCISWANIAATLEISDVLYSRIS